MNFDQKKVVIDVRMLNNSGIGVYIEHLVKGLVDTGKYSIVLIGSKADISAKFNVASFNKIINVDIPIYSLKEQVYLPFIIPKCDLFWSPHYNVPLFPILARKRIVTVHDTYHLAYSKNFNVFKVLYAKTILNGAVRLSDVVLTDSEFSKSEINKYTDLLLNNIEVLYVGIDTKSFHKSFNKVDKAEVTNRLRLPNRFILFVGNVKPNKNIVGLLKAFSIINRNHPDLKLVIVGKKEGFITGDKEVYKLLELNEQLKSNVYFTGFVSINDLPIIYNLATLLAFPSIYEGFGLPPLEAMACECPVVVSSIASIPEVCGDAGQYVNPFDVDSIADGINSLISDEALRVNLIELGKSRVKQFDWSISVDKFVNIIDNI